MRNTCGHGCREVFEEVGERRVAGKEEDVQFVVEMMAEVADVTAGGNEREGGRLDL